MNKPIRETAVRARLVLETAITAAIQEFERAIPQQCVIGCMITRVNNTGLEVGAIVMDKPPESPSTMASRSKVRIGSVEITKA